MHYSADVASNTSSPAPRASLAERRREREERILAATRRLFDSTGTRDAQLDDIARAVGINRAIIYRHFTSKEELFVLTVCSYLDELAAKLATASQAAQGSPQQLDAMVGAFVDYSIAHPAYVDCALSVMRHTSRELFDEISEGAMFRLGRGIVSCLRPLIDVLRNGMADGQFRNDDPTTLANMLYASGLGALQLARVGLAVREAAPGIPAVERVSAEQVKEHLRAITRALVTGPAE